MKFTNYAIRLRVVAVATMLVFAGLRPIQAQARNFVMISLGDSYAAGLGAPNVPSTSNQPPEWDDPTCHRSLNAPALLAVPKLSDGTPLVTFAPNIDRVGHNTMIPHFSTGHFYKSF
jgi:hypothetical protein